MPEILNLWKAVGTFGVAGLVFVIWYLYHKSTTTQLNRVIDLQADREERNFELLKDMISSISIQNGLLAKLNEKIESNQWCPYLKELQKKGDK